MKAGDFEFDGLDLYDYEKAKDRLVVLCATLGETVIAPQKHFCDIAITAQVSLGKTPSGGNAYARVSHDLRLAWGISEERLFADAIINSAKTLPVQVAPMFDILNEISPGEIYMPDDTGLYVVTNSERYNGASAIFYDGVMDEIADKLGGDFFVLPSSIHEVLVIKTGSLEAAELVEMVRMINQTEVKPNERLSDHVYVYRRALGLFLAAA